jgi:hypothetical protein
MCTSIGAGVLADVETAEALASAMPGLGTGSSLRARTKLSTLAKDLLLERRARMKLSARLNGIEKKWKMSHVVPSRETRPKSVRTINECLTTPAAAYRRDRVRSENGKKTTKEEKKKKKKKKKGFGEKGSR